MVLFWKLNSPDERNDIFYLEESGLFQSQFGVRSSKEKQQLLDKEKKKEIMDGKFLWNFPQQWLHQNSGLLCRNSSETRSSTLAVLQRK